MSRFILLSEPRNGSSFLQALLLNHVEIGCLGELLNEDYDVPSDWLAYATAQLNTLGEKKSITGFKLHARHALIRGISFLDIVRSLNVRWVIVVWRENVLETFVSLQIAIRTGCWYSETPATTADIEKIEIDVDELHKYVEETRRYWENIASSWPPDVIPLFVKYEDMLTDPQLEVRRILRAMSLDSQDYEFESSTCRQNPAPIDQKIDNFGRLSKELISTSVNVEDMILHAILDEGMQISPKYSSIVPDIEPPAPSNGWWYRVSEPYITAKTIENVSDALNSGSISSAGKWPRLMADKLKCMFGVEVAQPCCNGFAALVLALKVAGISAGDDVLIPTFTMVAVPNAVCSVGARPVPVDNAADDYNPDVATFIQAATPNTKAIIVTHTYGVPTKDMGLLTKVCEQKQWVLIEDISECAGISTTTSDGSIRLLGTFGHFVCASMYANKILQGGDGGFVLAKDPRHAYQLGSLVNHGFTRSYHFVHLEQAPNYKICGLAAAVACGSLDSVDAIIAHRSKLAGSYRQSLSVCKLQLMPKCGPLDTPWVFGVMTGSKSERQQLRDYLAQYGVETRNYFFPIHAQPAYVKMFHDLGDTRFTNAERLAECGFYLPSFTRLSDDDITWISSVVDAFYDRNKQIFECPESRVGYKYCASVNSQTLAIEVREYDRTGNFVLINDLHSYPLSAVRLVDDAEQFLLTECWDEGQIILRNIQDINKSIKNGHDSGPSAMALYLNTFSDYITSQTYFEQSLEEPWLSDNFSIDIEAMLCSSLTTTEVPALQLLCWLIRQACRSTTSINILELGAWLGGSTAIMAETARQFCQTAKLFAVDAFIWCRWMDEFNSRLGMRNGDSFLNLFLSNTSTVSEIVRPIQWQIGQEPFPTDLFVDVNFDIVYVDFTQDLDELETAWDSVEPFLKANETVVILNTLSGKTIPFITKHKDQLLAIAKPHGTRIKAFKYLKELEPSVDERTVRKVSFLSNTSWTHHHKNAFNVAIDALRSRLHSSDATVDFIPAVEEFVCDEPEKITRSWIGIVHGVPRDDEFYTPDLERLCSPRYRFAMKLCKGLFTLTRFQAQYLREHIENELCFPICALRLPTIFDPSFHSQSPKPGVEARTELMFVGSFARDFDFFFRVKVPGGLKKVLIAADELSIDWATAAPSDVEVRPRLSEDDYESALKKSLVLIALKYDGAANTLVVECIARDTPIVAPRIHSCTEYLGEHYPLLYEPGSTDLCDVITTDKVNEAVAYLAEMDKSDLSISSFCAAVESSSVLLGLSPHDANIPIVDHYDVTVCLCSYKRTINLEKILNNLFDKQDFAGSIQFIIWNNNAAREGVVRKMCLPYIRRNSRRRNLQLISSTTNHYCIIRACMANIMQGDVLLICDDDILPTSTFVQFFYNAHLYHRDDILGVRGNVFLPHSLDHNDPRKVWTDYQYVKFVDDYAHEQEVHFVHADACVIPRKALREFSSVDMPFAEFTLVDDYWMCFVLNHYFNRVLRKLQVTEGEHFERMSDSDEVGLALYTRPEVQDAKLQMYIYHMIRGWPTWNERVDMGIRQVKLRNSEIYRKKQSWFKNSEFFGFNVPSQLDRDDALDLRHRLGVRVVRIGVVGCKENNDFEFSGFTSNVGQQLTSLAEAVEMYAKLDIGVIIALHRRIACAELWTMIAEKFTECHNLIAYDLLNEPYTADDFQMHYADMADNSIYNASSEAALFTTMLSYWSAIRNVDPNTTVIVEPPFWGSHHALHRISDFIVDLKLRDDNIMASVHFYDPPQLVLRKRNRGRYSFPGEIPLYNVKYSELFDCNQHSVFAEIKSIKDWERKVNVKVFVGEFGIPRETVGAAEYLKTVANGCKKFGLSCLVYSFREQFWDAMNYELGPKIVVGRISRTPLPWNDNPLMLALQEISAMYGQHS